MTRSEFSVLPEDNLQHHMFCQALSAAESEYVTFWPFSV